MACRPRYSRGQGWKRQVYPPCQYASAQQSNHRAYYQHASCVFDTGRAVPNGYYPRHRIRRFWVRLPIHWSSLRALLDPPTRLRSCSTDEAICLSSDALHHEIKSVHKSQMMHSRVRSLNNRADLQPLSSLDREPGATANIWRELGCPAARCPNKW